MAPLFRYEITGLDHEPFLSQGESVTVDGVTMVRLGNRAMVPADDYFTSVAEAKLDLSLRLKAKVHDLLDRISALQDEALILAEMEKETP